MSQKQNLLITAIRDREPRQAFTSDWFPPPNNPSIQAKVRYHDSACQGSVQHVAAQLHQRVLSSVRVSAPFVNGLISSSLDATVLRCNPWFANLTITSSKADTTHTGDITCPTQFCASTFRPHVNYLTGRQRPGLVARRKHKQLAKVLRIASAGSENREGRYI
jgi:hypothetical protein